VEPDLGHASGGRGNSEGTLIRSALPAKTADAAANSIHPYEHTTKPSDGGWFFLSIRIRMNAVSSLCAVCPGKRRGFFFWHAPGSAWNRRQEGGIKMQVQVNGKKVDLEAEVKTVQDLLAHYRLQEKIVVVERNGEIVDRSAYESTPIADGDRVEIVHFVGGG
jgi:sulfur carrier protein